ncbi:MAG: hypothetical protein WC976_06090 [Caldisericia bacterium]
MKILLLDTDSRIPNLALMKISAYYKKQGAEVQLNNELCNPDKVFISKVFTAGKITYPGPATIGGSGYDLKVTLPKEIESMMPDYDLYGCDYSLGFTTRGCIRDCKFCIVREKEGNFHVVGDIYDFWDKRHKKVLILDNNILADKKHFTKICGQIQKENLAVDCNQGLDIRLVDEEIAKTLSATQMKRVRFSFDNVGLEPIVRTKMKILVKYIKPSKIFFYVLCGFDTSFDEDMRRVQVLKSLGVDPFIMPYHKNSRLLNEFARWCNIFFFRNTPFEDFLKLRKCSWVLEQKDIKI